MRSSYSTSSREELSDEQKAEIKALYSTFGSNHMELMTSVGDSELNKLYQALIDGNTELLGEEDGDEEDDDETEPRDKIHDGITTIYRQCVEDQLVSYEEAKAKLEQCIQAQEAVLRPNSPTSLVKAAATTQVEVKIDTAASPTSVISNTTRVNPAKKPSDKQAIDTRESKGNTNKLASSAQMCADLCYAVSEDDAAKVGQLLREMKENLVNFKDEKGVTAFQYAVSWKRHKIVSMLLNDANLDEFDSQNHTPLYNAVINEDLKTVEILTAKSTLSIENSNIQRTALEEAIIRKKPAIVKVLVENMKMKGQEIPDKAIQLDKGLRVLKDALQSKPELKRLKERKALLSINHHRTLIERMKGWNIVKMSQRVFNKKIAHKEINEGTVILIKEGKNLKAHFIRYNEAIQDPLIIDPGMIKTLKFSEPKKGYSEIVRFPMEEKPDNPSKGVKKDLIEVDKLDAINQFLNTLSDQGGPPYMAGLGYTSNGGGICSGYVNRWAEAQLIGEEKKFSERVRFICSYPDLIGAIEKAETARIKKWEALIEKEIAPEFKAIKDPKEHKKAISARLNTKSGALNKMLDASLSDGQKQLLEVKQFFDGIEFNFNARKKISTDLPGSNDTDEMSAFTSSISLEKEGGAKSICNILGTYNKEELKDYLKGLGIVLQAQYQYEKKVIAGLKQKYPEGWPDELNGLINEFDRLKAKPNEQFDNSALLNLIAKAVRLGLPPDLDSITENLAIIKAYPRGLPDSLHLPVERSAILLDSVNQDKDMNHRNGLKYDFEKNEWLLVDSNNLTSESTDSRGMATKIMAGFWQPKLALFNTEIVTTLSNPFRTGFTEKLNTFNEELDIPKDFTKRIKQHGNILLTEAGLHDDHHFLTKLIKKNPDIVNTTINISDPNKSKKQENVDLLTAAVLKGAIKCAQLLISEKANVNVKYKGTPLWELALAKGQAVLAEKMLGKIDLSKTDEGRTPLHYAVHQGNLALVKILVRLMNPKDLDLKDNTGHTAFQYAALHGTAEMVAILKQKTTMTLTIPKLPAQTVISEAAQASARSTVVPASTSARSPPPAVRTIQQEVKSKNIVSPAPQANPPDTTASRRPNSSAPISAQPKSGISSALTAPQQALSPATTVITPQMTDFNESGKSKTKDKFAVVTSTDVSLPAQSGLNRRGSIAAKPPTQVVTQSVLSQRAPIASSVITAPAPLFLSTPYPFNKPVEFSNGINNSISTASAGSRGSLIAKPVQIDSAWQSVREGFAQACMTFAAKIPVPEIEKAIEEFLKADIFPLLGVTVPMCSLKSEQTRVIGLSITDNDPTKTVKVAVLEKYNEQQNKVVSQLHFAKDQKPDLAVLFQSITQQARLAMKSLRQNNSDTPEKKLTISLNQSDSDEQRGAYLLYCVKNEIRCKDGNTVLYNPGSDKVCDLKDNNIKHSKADFLKPHELTFQAIAEKISDHEKNRLQIP